MKLTILRENGQRLMLYRQRLIADDDRNAVKEFVNVVLVITTFACLCRLMKIKVSGAANWYPKAVLYRDQGQNRQVWRGHHQRGTAELN